MSEGKHNTVQRCSFIFLSKFRSLFGDLQGWHLEVFVVSPKTDVKITVGWRNCREKRNFNQVALN